MHQSPHPPNPATIACGMAVLSCCLLASAAIAQPRGHLLYNKDGMPVGPFTTCGNH